MSLQAGPLQALHELGAALIKFLFFLFLRDKLKYDFFERISCVGAVVGYRFARTEESPPTAKGHFRKEDPEMDGNGSETARPMVRMIMANQPARAES